MSDKQIRSQACWLKDGSLIKGSAEEFFPFFNGKKHVISLVGGGGKSTLMEYLAQRFAARGMKTAIMTTTRIARPEKIACSMEECRACWASGEYAACGEAMENGKFRAPQQEMIDWLLEEADVILAKGMANCETMYGCGYNVYYAFLVKCQRFVNIFGKPMFTPIFTPEHPM